MDSSHQPEPNARQNARIGIFGGSFDPVHNGHVMVARAALAEAGLDRLLIVPAAQSPFKPGQTLAPPMERLAWLRLAFLDEPCCEVDAQEIRRADVSYTIDTVRAVAERFPGAELFVLIGADHVATLPDWREADVLAEAVHFVVVPRPGEDGGGGGLELDFPEPFRGILLRGEPMAISASDLRARLRAGESIEKDVPPAVAAALKVEHSY